jgi:DNA-binding NarL/FixJ family response regulator
MIPPMEPSILIVDDHDAFRSQARRLLERQGFAVVAEAANGSAAIEAAQRTHPDVVLLDVYLGEANGFDVAEQIHDQVPDTTVVMTSGNDRATFASRLRHTSAAGFIPKTELTRANLEALFSEP